MDLYARKASREVSGGDPNQMLEHPQLAPLNQGAATLLWAPPRCLSSSPSFRLSLAALHRTLILGALSSCSNGHYESLYRWGLEYLLTIKMGALPSNSLFTTTDRYSVHNTVASPSLNLPLMCWTYNKIMIIVAHLYRYQHQLLTARRSWVRLPGQGSFCVEI